MREGVEMAQFWLETYKVALGFVLVTLFGGLFAAAIQSIRERENRRDTKRGAIRDLIARVDELYRSSKQVKRAIRSRLRVQVHGDQTIIDGPFFESRMDELSVTQLALERCHQLVRTRTDLFAEECRKRLIGELRYAEAYLHDVVEEFEKRRIRRLGKDYIVPGTCVMLGDFLGPRWLPDNIKEDFAALESADLAVNRYCALQ